MAPLLKSKESNKANDLKSLKTDLMRKTKSCKHKTPHRGFLSVDKEINKAVRPVKLNNI